MCLLEVTHSSTRRLWMQNWVNPETHLTVAPATGQAWLSLLCSETSVPWIEAIVTMTKKKNALARPA